MKIIFSALAILLVFSIICVAIYLPQVASMTSAERSVWFWEHPFMSLLGLFGHFIVIFGSVGVVKILNG